MTDRLKTNIVPPEGPLNAKIVFIGEAPGEEEDNDLRPFVGSAGQLLNRCLRTAGIIRGDVLLWNCFSQRPPRNAVNHFFKDKSNRFLNWEGEEHVENLRKWLIKLRDMGNLNLIVALGAVPMRILTAKEGINKWRGSVVPCTLVEGLKVYCTFHPSHVNRTMQEQKEKKLSGEKKKQAENTLPVFLKDLERIKIQAEDRFLNYPEREFHIDLSKDEYIYLLDSWAEGNVDCSVDIETLPDETGPILWCIGFSPHPGRAYVIPWIKNRRFAWSTREEAEILQAISRYFLSDAKKIFQGGGQYDLPVLGRYYGLRVKPNTYEDTMWLHHASYPYIRKGLASLTSLYTWEPYYKDDGKVHFGKRTSDTAEFVYNARDDCVTREVYPVVRRDAKELGTYNGYRRTLRCTPSHLAMTLRGVRMDLEAKEKLYHDFTERAKASSLEVNKLTGGIHNLNSSDQKRKLLYGYLGLDIQFNRKTGKPTVDQEALQKLAKKYRESSDEGRIVRLILEYQKFNKLGKDFAGLELDTDGRMRTSYGYVSTWRTNSKGSPFVFNLDKKKQAGGNLQQIPKRSEEGRLVRRLFLPDEGKVMVAADYKQAEAMVVAYEAEDLAKIELYKRGDLDPHWEYAKEIFDIPDSVKYLPDAIFRDNYTHEDHKLKEFRNLGKTIRHATNYEVGPMQFQGTLVKEGFHFEFKVCKRLLIAAKNKDPMLSEWKRKIRDKLKAQAYLISSYGRKREFLGRLNDDTYRAAYAFSPQNTVGEMLQEAIQNIHDKHIETIEPLLNVHDEVVTQVPIGRESWAIEKIRECMTIPLEIHGRELIIPVEFKVGPNWGQMEEVE